MQRGQRPEILKQVFFFFLYHLKSQASLSPTRYTSRPESRRATGKEGGRWRGSAPRYPQQGLQSQASPFLRVRPPPPAHRAEPWAGQPLGGTLFLHEVSLPSTRGLGVWGFAIRPAQHGVCGEGSISPGKATVTLPSVAFSQAELWPLLCVQPPPCFHPKWECGEWRVASVCCDPPRAGAVGEPPHPCPRRGQPIDRGPSAPHGHLLRPGGREAQL